MRRFDLRAARVVHRVGVLQPLDQIVLVAVTSAHRGQAFQACEFLMDYLKTQAPFWKKETTPEGAHWVDARVSDDAALARWGIAGGQRRAVITAGAVGAGAGGRGSARRIGALAALAARAVAERSLGRLSARHACWSTASAAC